jgi:N-acetylneuraminic acid mutarotase
MIITVGGTFWEERNGEKKTKRWSNAVYQLDTKKMEWKKLPDYPLPVGDAFAVGIGNKLYVIGGRSEFRGNAELFTLDLSAKDRRWIASASLPHPRWAHIGGVIDGVIYIVGGSEGDPSKEHETNISRNVIALDTRHSEEGWRYVADLPNPTTEWHMAATCAGKFYLVGGLLTLPDNQFLPQSEVFLLDKVAGQWKQLKPLPIARGSGACVCIDDRYVLITGGIAQGLPKSSSQKNTMPTYFSNECLLYDTRLNSYKPLTPLKKALADQGLIVRKRILYAIGGEDSPFQTRTDTVQIGKLR